MRLRKNKSTQQKPLRLWPGMVAMILIILVKLVVPKVISDALPVAIFGRLFLGLVVIIWWMFFSRAPRLKRWSAVPLMIIALIVVRPFLHKSIATAGMEMLFLLLAFRRLQAKPGTIRYWSMTSC